MALKLDKTLRNRALAAVFALVLVIVAFILFMNANQQRILDQNMQYVEGTTQQTAGRVDAMFSDALSAINAVATMYEVTLTSVEVDADDLARLEESTPFDYLTFTNAAGITYDDRERTTDSATMEYYLRGMEGESGVCLVREPAFSEGNALVFYTPLHYKGKPVGVLSGVFNEASLTEALTTFFFGEQTSTYLCDRDGYIVARSSPFASTFKDVFGMFEDGAMGVSLPDLQAAFDSGESMDFTYRSLAGTGSVFLMKLPAYDLMLVRTFPASITNRMVSNANGAGVGLMIGIVLAFVALIVILVLQAAHQKRQLLLEKQDANRIIDVSTNLFARFVTLDLNTGTYEYLKRGDVGAELLPEGTYEAFSRFWLSQAYEDSDKVALSEIIDRDKMRVALAPSVPYLLHEYRMVRDGKPRTMQVSTLCLERDERDRPTKVLYAIQDVTDNKEREAKSREALEEAYRAADQASRAKSDFLNSMSHDIRTPMNSIMGLTAIASMHADDPARVKDCLTKITAASRHLLGLINEVLDMAKIESGNIGLTEEDFDLSETVESLLTIVGPEASAKRLNLKVSIDKLTHEHVMGDAMRLQQVFVNIMSNSVKFTDDGGTVELRITEKPSRIHGSGCYEFVFADTGCGMSEDFVEHMFEPFARANDNRLTNNEGTGLGLSIVKSVVSLMNGTIDVKSKLGEGSVITVTVHLKLRNAEDSSAEGLEGLRVLVADDNADACEHACVMLRELGMVPDPVRSGAEAVERALATRGTDRDYAAIVLDWRMPGMSGLETAAQIRERVSSDVPIIVLSAYDWSTIEREARATGVDAFVAKPLFKSRLAHVLRELLVTSDEAEGDEQALLQSCDCSGRRILLAEDNGLAAAIAIDLLEMTGAEVDRVENGQQAVDALVEKPEGYYDLVLMDIQMPVLNGYEATRAVRAAGESRADLAEIPIVALTADAFLEDMERSRDAGMNAHLSKPLEIGVLVKTLNRWLPSR